MNHVLGHSWLNSCNDTTIVSSMLLCTIFDVRVCVHECVRTFVRLCVRECVRALVFVIEVFCVNWHLRFCAGNHVDDLNAFG